MSAPEARDFEVTSSSFAIDFTIVKVRGEVDMATSSELEAALEPVLASRVVLDLSECAFLDSSGIRVVLTSAERAKSTGGGLSLVASDPGIRRVLEIAGIEDRVSIHPTVEAARLEAAG